MKSCSHTWKKPLPQDGIPKEAHRAFGSALRAGEASHNIRVAGWLESLLADLRFGWRQLGRNKVASAAAVLSLALGIGSCVAAFRLIDALLWRPLPISGSSRLYVLSRKLIGPEGRPIEDGYWATPDFNLMRDAVKDQADLIAISDADRTDITWSTDDDMEKAHVAYVSGNMFPLFRLEPAVGRLLNPADDRGPGLNPYAVLSWDYWNYRFGRDPHVLGRSLHMGDQTFEIIGVGPRDFTGTEKGTVTDIFLPLSMNRLATQDGVDWHRTFLMLKPGVNPAIALEPLRQHLSAVSRAFELGCSTCLRGMTQADIDRYLNKTLVFNPAGAGISELQRDYRRLFGVLGLLVALVLLIACVNVANMMTAQAAARAQEMALRISIGAGRRRLVQLILCAERAARSPGFRPWRILCGVVGALRAQSRQSARQPCAPRPSRRLACASLRLRAHYPRRSIAWFASCSPCLCRPARRRPQRW